MSFEVIIGLEVHVRLLTSAKMLCPCAAVFGDEPNTHVCPVCGGASGALPRLNYEVAERAVKAGLALNCEIARVSGFDRKNYSSPDMPKGYQVTQFYAPICRDGYMDIDVGGAGGTEHTAKSGGADHADKANARQKRIRIREMHIEEDSGRLLYDDEGNIACVDLNRCGVPLLEIVSEPDLRSAGEAVAYLEKLRETMLYLGVSDCKMQEGSLRADVNISLRRQGGASGGKPGGTQGGAPMGSSVGGEPGAITEMKNLNSLKAIARAIEHEAARQAEILSGGGQVARQTRRWDDRAGTSYAMRSKESEQDYHYCPEPDLPPLIIDEAWLQGIKAAMPETAHQKRQRYTGDYGLPQFEAAVLTGHKSISDLFEGIMDCGGEPLESARLVTGEVMRLANAAGTAAEDLAIDAKKLAVLVSLLQEGKISRNAYKDAIEAVFLSDADPEAYIKEKGLLMASDGPAVVQAVREAVEDNPAAVSDYRAGKHSVFTFLMGQSMKRLGSSANPAVVRQELEKRLSEKG